MTLAGIARIADYSIVAAGKVKGRPTRNLNDPWDLSGARAGLEEVRIHDVRHTFASRALALGEGLPIIGRLLGHRRIETTARSAHLARDSVREAADVL